MIISGSSHFIAPVRYSVTTRSDAASYPVTYLSRTPSSAGSSTIWSFSTWFKNTPFNGFQFITAGGGTAGDYTYVMMRGTGAIEVGHSVSNSVAFDKSTTATYTAATWYHLLFAYDSTQATTTNRARVYINGTEVTTFTGTDPGANQTTYINTTIAHNVGRYTSNPSTSRDNTSLAETYLVDGTQLTPSSFGVTVGSSWRPIPYSGSLGTNGFYLNYQNRSNFGQALRGSSFTANNFLGSDQTIDYPN